MVDGFSCILDFPTFSGGGPPDPHLKEIHQLHPQNLSSTTTAAKGNKKQKKKKTKKKKTKKKKKKKKNEKEKKKKNEKEKKKKKKKKRKKKKKKKNRVGKPSPIKTIYEKFIFRLYRNWKKGGGRWGKIFFVWFVFGLFETDLWYSRR